jgi:hypothetical protein
VTIRSSEVHLYYNLQVFYWHFLESLWLFIFLVSVSTQKRSYLLLICNRIMKGSGTNTKTCIPCITPSNIL